MGNPFDQFDAPAQKSGNPFDQFDAPQVKGKAKPIDLSLGEKFVSSLPTGVQSWLANPSIAGVGLGKGSAVNGAMMGAADPVVGAMQLAANLPGISDAISTKPTLSGLVTGNMAKTNPVNAAIDAKNAEYESARSQLGRNGFDAARFVGGVVSPANIALAKAIPVNGASMGQKAWNGAMAGATGGLAAPVENADQSYWTPKAAQGTFGAVGGGLLAPLASKVGENIYRRAFPMLAVDKSVTADKIIIDAVNNLKKEGVTLSQFDLNTLRAEVLKSLDEGVAIDAAALARKLDFKNLGIAPTLGQITRDAAIFSKEKNLRGVSGVGEPLLQRFDAQSKRLHGLMDGMSSGAADEFTAGQSLIRALNAIDDGMKSNVDTAYLKARDHLGRAAPMDSAAFSSAANHALDNEMLGGVLPAHVRSILNDVTLGKIPFNVNTAVQIDQTLSRIQRGASDAEKYAIGKVRDALNKAPIADNVGEDAKLAFDAARKTAKSRFDTHDAIPALKAAIDGDTSAQDFVRRFLINGKAEDVASLARVLPGNVSNEAKRQFGAALERAAFGQNVTGDKAFLPEQFAKFINQPGMRQKLEAFFSPDEIMNIQRIARVGGYINTFPANSTVNTSNTASAVMNLMRQVPGVPASIGLLNSARNAAGNASAVKSSIAANPPGSPVDIPKKQLELISRILGGGIGGIAGVTGTGIGNQ